LLNQANALASDGVDLFWIDTASTLWRAPVGGGTPSQLASNVSWVEPFLYLDATNVYFAGPDGISSLPKQGGTASLIVPTQGSIYAATAAGGSVYWMEDDPGDGGATTPTSFQGFVKSSSLAGGAVATLTTLGAEGPSSQGAIAISDSLVFFFGDGLETLPIGGGTPTTLSSTERCLQLLGGPAGVYCNNTPIVLLAADGGSTTISTQASQPQSMALDTTNLYWVNPTRSGSVVTAPMNGGPFVTVAYDELPMALAVDDAAVYWSDSAGTIQRADKIK
jgi:hypothetical protein